MSSRFRTLHLNRRAIVYGCLTDVGASMAAGIPLLLFAVATSSERASLESTIQSAGYVTASLILGLVATALGGYVAARKSPRAELTNALAVGIVMVLLGILLLVLIRIPLDLWGTLGLVLTIPAALASGLTRLSQLERSAATN